MFSFLTLNTAGLGAIKKRMGAIREREIIFWGMAALAVLFLVLIFIDGWLFYATVSRQDVLAPSAGAAHMSLSDDDITATVRLLDSRAQKLTDILDGQ